MARISEKQIPNFRTIRELENGELDPLTPFEKELEKHFPKREDQSVARSIIARGLAKTPKEALALMEEQMI